MEQPAEQPSQTTNFKSDDYIIPFQLESSGARGRLIRLGTSVDTILTKHAYPDPVSRLLGEAVTLTAMLGASLKMDGKFILQTQSKGSVSFLVVHFSSPGHLRGYVSYNAEEIAKLNPNALNQPLLGDGHLAMTIDPGKEMERYQGIVALTGTTLTDAAHEYFAQSEQIPTFIKIAVARHFTGGVDGTSGHWSWRAGGLMVQKLTQEGGRPRGDEILPPVTSEEAETNEPWRRAQVLAATVEDHELLDPTLPPERLLYRLFHEENVRAFDAMPIEAKCNCSRERVSDMLEQFSQEEITSMAEGDAINVTCEFCNTSYRFNVGDYMKSAPSPDSPPV